MDWISVKDKLPKEFENVLTIDNIFIYKVDYIVLFNDEYIWGRTLDEHKKVTHWMPLPNKPNMDDNMHWISVKDKLPEVGKDVIIFAFSLIQNGFDINEKYCAIDRLTQVYGPIDFTTNALGYGEVSHWMPLPKPPKD